MSSPILLAKVVPEELQERRQWVLWRREAKPGAKKPDKVPYTANGYKASTTNPETWSAFSVVLERAARPRFCDGVGYVFAPDDPYTGIDLDNIWPSDAAEAPAWAQVILDTLGDSYGEGSPSDTGFKFWCRASIPRSVIRPVEHGRIELYDRERFFTVTGRSNGVRVVTDHQEDIDELIAALGRGPDAGPPEPIGDVIPYGTQHNTLVSLAGTMHRRGMCIDAIDAALQITNAQQCEKPGPPRNIRAIAESTRNWKR